MSIKAKNRRAQPVSKLIGSSSKGPMSLLMKKAQLLGQAQLHLEQQLPEHVKHHVFVGGYSQGRLTLMTNQATHLTWLRYEQPRLITLMRQLEGFEALMGFQLKVRPMRVPRKPLQQPRHLGIDAADNLLACAEDVSDPRLKSAIERLAARARATPSDSEV